MSTFPFDEATLNRMYRYCFSLTNDQDAAFDLLQDGLERYLRASSEMPRHPFTFLRRIIRNRFIDGLRARDARQLETAAETDTDCVAIGFASLEGLVIAHQELQRIWDRLGPFDRELLCLWAADGCTAREAADQLGVPIGTVAARIHRLRQRLTRLRDAERAAQDAAGG